MYNDLRYFSVRSLKKRTATLFKNVMKNGCLLTTRIHLGNKLSWLMEEPSLLFHEQTLVFLKA